MTGSGAACGRAQHEVLLEPGTEKWCFGGLVWDERMHLLKWWVKLGM